MCRYGRGVAFAVAPGEDKQQTGNVRHAGLLTQAIGGVLAVVGRDVGGGSGQHARGELFQPLGAARHDCAAVLDLLAEGALPARGFVRQEEIGLGAFLANRFGRLYGPAPVAAGLAA